MENTNTPTCKRLLLQSICLVARNIAIHQHVSENPQIFGDEEAKRATRYVDHYRPYLLHLEEELKGVKR